MRRDDIRAALESACALSAHTEYVVAGSLSVLGLLDQPPQDMSMSIDIDFFPLRDPGRASDIAAVLGEDSDFHQRNGYYLDAISPALPTLPKGWEDRLVRVELGSVTACFLDVHDTAISKYARGEAQDLRWLDAGFAAGLLRPSIVRARMRFSTEFYDDAERERAWSALRAHEAALLPASGLSRPLLEAVRGHTSREVADIDRDSGEYVGEVLWCDAVHLVQAVDANEQLIHALPQLAEVPQCGEWVCVRYQDGALEVEPVDPLAEKPDTPSPC